jgi:hypothetical protein
MAPTRAANSRPANAEIVEEAMNSFILISATSTPEYVAASALFPMT